MLQNSGAYGPNETPINASTPVNMSQVPSPLNMGRSLQNMGDIAQQQLRGPSGHYNIPTYPAYNHQTIDMRSHLNAFSGHHLKGFPNEFLPHSATSVHNTRWQNGMSPLNLNAQSTYVPNMQNFHSPYEKLQPNHTTIPSSQKEQISLEKRDLNLSETLPKPCNDDNYFFNPSLDRFSHYNMNYDASISKERTSLDYSKRKSLENTVKLIENILINTTKDSDHEKTKKEETITSKTENISENTEKNEANETLTDKNLDLDTKSDKKQNESQNDITPENYIKANESEELSIENKNQVSEVKTTLPIESVIIEASQVNLLNETDTPQETVLPKVVKDMKVKIEIDIEPIANVNVKEEMHTMDEDYQSTFHRDVNGTLPENVKDGKIIDSESSVNEAQAAIKLGSPSDLYYECPHCALLFNHSKRFLIHTKWHTFGLTNEKRTLEAREREIQRKQRREARVVDQLHKTIEEEGATYPCKDCPKIFCSKGSLKNHRTRFHSSRIRECGVCGEVCMGWAGLKAHAATHESPFRCDQCGKHFSHKHSLARHAETHIEENEKTLPCEICGKLFAVLSRLKEHQRVHMRAERGAVYQCSYCAKSFFQAYSLTICGKLFAVLSRLKEHQRVHMRAERGAVYQCSYCAKSFFQAYSLTIHERTHRNEKPYTCTICNSSYGTNSSLKRHLKVSHNRSKPFECSQCGRCFVSERALTSHIVRVHTTVADDADPLAPRKKRRRNKKPKDPNKQLQKEPKTKSKKDPTIETEQVIT